MIKSLSVFLRKASSEGTDVGGTCNGQGSSGDGQDGETYESTSLSGHAENQVAKLKKESPEQVFRQSSPKTRLSSIESGPPKSLEDRTKDNANEHSCSKDYAMSALTNNLAYKSEIEINHVSSNTHHDPALPGSRKSPSYIDSQTPQPDFQTYRNDLRNRGAADLEGSIGPSVKSESSPMSSKEEAIPIPDEPSNARLAIILGSMWVGVFLTAIDSTIVATLLLPISNSFNALSSLAWLGSAYLIGQSAAQPLCGRLTDIFGRRAGLVVANVTFGVGTLICGLSHHQGVLIFGRVVAGLGGGAIYAVSTFVGSDLVPNRKRALITGINNIIYGVGSGLGGLYGGWVNDSLGWRDAFLIQVPFIFVALMLVICVVKVPRKHVNRPKLQRVDFLGIATMVAALTLFLIGLSAGGNLVSWGSPLVLVSLPASGICLVLFIIVEARFASEPIIPLHLIRNRTVISASLSYGFDHLAAYGIVFYIPIFLQVQGYSSAQAGLRFVPNSAGQAAGALLTGIIIRATGRYYRLNILIHIFTMLGSGLLIKLSYSTASWYPFVILLITGLGFGGMLVVNLTAIIASVSREKQALATSASFVFRSCGSVLGLAVGSAAFQNTLKSKLWQDLSTLNNAKTTITAIRHSFDEIQRISSDIRPVVVHSYVEALRMVFVAMFVATVCSTAASLCMREHVLHIDIARTKEGRR